MFDITKPVRPLSKSQILREFLHNMEKEWPIVLVPPNPARENVFMRQYFPESLVYHVLDTSYLGKILVRQHFFVCTQCGRVARGVSPVYISIERKSGKRNQMVNHTCVPCNRVCASSFIQ